MPVPSNKTTTTTTTTTSTTTTTTQICLLMQSSSAFLHGGGVRGGGNKVHKVRGGTVPPESIDPFDQDVAKPWCYLVQWAAANGSILCGGTVHLSLLFSFLGEGGESMSSLMQETNLNSITVCSEGSFQVLFLGDTYMGMEQVGGE